MAKKKKAPAKKGGGLASKMNSQVQAETSLRYAPQTRELKSALSDLRGQLTQDVQRAHAGAEGIRTAAVAAKPELVKAYGEGTAVADRTQQDLVGQLGGGLLSGAAARDAEGTKRRLGEAQAMATADLTKRATDAKSGEALQVSQLTSRFGSDAGRIRDKLSGVASDAGTYAAARSGELSADATKQAHDTAQKSADRKTRLAVGGVDASGKVRPGGPKDPKIKPAKPADVAKVKKAAADFNDDLSTARAAVARYAAKLPRAKVAALLSGGASVPSSAEQVDTAKLDKLIAANPPAGEAGHLSESELRRRATTPGSPAVTVDPIASKAALSAALDLAYDKHLSPPTIAKLRAKYPGIVVKKTGLPTRGSASSAPVNTGSRGSAPSMR